MSENKNTRYSFYIVSKEHKKNIVRTLHYLTNFNYILKEDTLNSNEISCYKLVGNSVKSEFIDNDVIYKKESSSMELSDYEIVINELDNLALNVNAKNIKLLKKFIKKHTIFKVPEGTAKTTTLFDEDKKELYITYIANKLNITENYALRIYNQLHSRVIFRYFHELYTNPTAVIIQKNKIIPIILDELQELKIIENFIKRFKWIFQKSILNELRKRRKQYIQDEIEREKYLISIRDIDVVNSFFNFNIILDTTDKLYKDAIQILFREADSLCEVEGYFNYIEVDWNYELSNEADNWYEEYLEIDKKAVEYITEYNELNKNNFEIIYKSQSGKNDLEYGDEYYNDIIDTETYYDETSLEQTKQSALSFNKQWENTFKILYQYLKSDNPSKNKYLQILNFSNEIQNEYNELLKNDPKFFNKDGKVSKNKYYKEIDQNYYDEIKKHTKEATNEEIRKMKSKLMKTKIVRWELLYKLSNNIFIQSLNDFNIDKLQFNIKINMDDCPF